MIIILRASICSGGPSLSLLILPGSEGSGVVRSIGFFRLVQSFKDAVNHSGLINFLVKSLDDHLCSLLHLLFLGSCRHLLLDLILDRPIQIVNVVILGGAFQFFNGKSDRPLLWTGVWQVALLVTSIAYVLTNLC